jgi:enoyl-CoA hydratase/carnithine racemase
VIEQTTVGDVVVLRMDAAENAFNPTMLDALEEALDAVEQREGASALVLTGTGKVFSYGIDLLWMQGASIAEQDQVMRRVHDLLARVLTFPTTTVAALNGHAFGGGAMLALACDQRVMRADRGYVCLPEVDFQLPFTPGMATLIRRRLSPAVAHEAMLTGQRYGGEDALARGIVDAAVTEDRVIPDAVERAQALAAKGRVIVQAIKRELYSDAMAALATSELNRELLPAALSPTAT